MLIMDELEFATVEMDAILQIILAVHVAVKYFVVLMVLLVETFLMQHFF
jgi:hypothetical protein